MEEILRRRTQQIPAEPPVETSTSCGEKLYSHFVGKSSSPKRHKKNTRQPEILHFFHFQVHQNWQEKLDLEVRIKTNLMS